MRKRFATLSFQQALQGCEHHFPVLLGLLSRLLIWIVVLTQRGASVTSFLSQFDGNRGIVLRPSSSPDMD